MPDLEAPMPQIRLLNGMVIRFEARDPTGNGNIGGVEVRDVAIYGESLGGSADDLADATPHYISIAGGGG